MIEALTGLFGVFVPILIMAFVAFILWLKHQQKLLDHQQRLTDSTAHASAERAAQYAAHNHELEQRVRVLERIVTDRGYDVAAQIEALRDTRRVETEDDAKR